MRKRVLSLVLIVCMGLTLLPTAALAAPAEEGEIEIVGTTGLIWGAFGQAVQYKMKGSDYVWDTRYAPTHINREAWGKMTDAQRKLTSRTVYTNAAKTAAFGAEGRKEIILWNKTNSDYYRANKLWKARVARRTFPELTDVFGPNRSIATLHPNYTEIKSYSENIPANIDWWERTDRFKAALAEVEREYEIGRQYYQEAVDMRTDGIANTVTITITQCTLMLSDLLFIPSVTQVATNASSGQIADVLNVLKGFVEMEDSDFSDKFARFQAGELGVPFTPEETVKLYGALMDTYAQMAKDSIPRVAAAMEKLENRYDLLLSGYEMYQADEARRVREKAAEEEAYLDALAAAKEEAEAPSVVPYTGLNFQWYTAEQLANTFPGTMTSEERKDAVFDKVLEHKADLDAEAKASALIICGNLIDAYDEAKKILDEADLALSELTATVETGCKAETIATYTGLDLNNDGYYNDFNGRYTFENAMSASGTAVSDAETNYPLLLAQLEAGMNELEPLKPTVQTFLDENIALAGQLQPYLEAMTSYISQLEQLNTDYLALYNAVVWIPAGGDEHDFINPLNNAVHTEYQVNAVTEAYKDSTLEWPEEKLYKNGALNTEDDLTEISETLPQGIYNDTYEIYEMAADALDEVDTHKSTVQEYFEKFKADKKAYNDELDARFNAYLAVQTEMEAKYARLKQLTDGYEALWAGAYFEGAGNYNNTYHVDTTIISYSAFDAASMRNDIRGGKGASAIASNIRALAEYAASGEAIVADLLAQIEMLEIEMSALDDGRLSDYAQSQGENYKTKYSIRDEVYPQPDGGRWTRLENNSYFDLHDIASILAALADDSYSQVFAQMNGYRQELLGYLSSSSVDTVKVSNRMYDIYKYALRVYELYNGSYFNNTLWTEQQREALLKIYMNGTGTGDISGTLYDITHKHDGTSYEVSTLPVETGQPDFWGPVGSFGDPALDDDSVSMSAPLFHPCAAGASAASASISVYGDGWEQVATASGAQVKSRSATAPITVSVSIDSETDALTITATGLENGKEYKFDWSVTYNYGSGTETKTDDEIKTIHYEPAIVAKAVLAENSCFDAAVTVTNLTGETVSSKYVYADGYDEAGVLIATAGAPLADLGSMEVSTLTLSFDKPVYSVSARLADEQATGPASLVILMDGGESGIAVTKPSEPIQLTSVVYDAQGDEISGSIVSWSVSPADNGVSVGDTGAVAIAANAAVGNYTIAASAGGTAWDEVSLLVTDSVATTVPGAPTSLSATPGDGQVILSWTAPADGGGTITSYEYQQDGGAWTATGDTSTSYTVTGLTNGTEYTFKVRAVNAIGAGAASSADTATPTAAATVPGAPTSLSATPGDGQVVLIWTAPADGGGAITRYEYQQDDGAWTTTGGTTTSYTVTGLTNGTEYSFKVRAVNAIGEGTASNADTATPAATPSTYLVTVNGSYASPTGAGNYAQGTTVTISAGTRSSYRFTGWTASPADVSFANASSTTTTFSMPATAVTVTANWSYDGGGGGGGGGGYTPPTYDLPASGNKNNVNAEATVSNGTATVTVSASHLETILNDADTKGSIEINAGLDMSIDTVSILTSLIERISEATQDADKAITGLDIVTDSGTVSFDKAALAALAEQATGDTVAVHVEEIAQSDLTATQRAAMTGEHADDLVIEVTAKSGGTAITNYNSGKITVTVPYMLKTGETAEGVCVWHLATDGTLTLMKCTYDAKTKTVSFVTDHLSDFIVGYDAAKINPDTGAWDNPFTDVTEDNWFYEDVALCHMLDLMKGTSDTTFSPYATTTRGMIVTILYRLEGEHAVSGANPFDDVADGKWYTSAVIWAAANKIVGGYGNGKFGPEDDITREQMAAILYRYEQYKGGGLVGSWYFLLDHPDAAKISDWADEAMHWCVMNGIIQGSDGYLMPKGNAERCQAAAMLIRFLNNVK